MYRKNPLTQEIRVMDKRTYTMEIRRLDIITKDNLTVMIDAVSYYRIIDVKKVLYRLNDPYDSVKDICYAGLRIICGEFTL